MDRLYANEGQCGAGHGDLDPHRHGGRIFGGNVLAPMLGAVTDTPNDFSVFSMMVALASAAACLAIGNLLSNRYGV